MASTPEGKVKDKVKRMLKKYGAYQFWPVQTGYGAPTLDCLACYNGFFVGIETKAPGKHPTPRQQLTMEDMTKAGGRVLVIGEKLEYTEDGKGTYSGLGELEAWLLMLKD